MSDTPRTDALADEPCPVDLTFSYWHQVKYERLCRQLERELAAAQAALAQVQLDKAEYDALKAKFIVADKNTKTAWELMVEAKAALASAEASDKDMRGFHHACIVELYNMLGVDGSDGEFRFKWVALELADKLRKLARYEAAGRELPEEPFFVIFDGPPSHESGRFVEVENAQGKGIAVGEWKPNSDTAFWQLGPFYSDKLRTFAAAQATRADLMKECLCAIREDASRFASMTQFSEEDRKLWARVAFTTNVVLEDGGRSELTELRTALADANRKLWHKVVSAEGMPLYAEIDRLNAALAAQTVRAEENERDARRWKFRMLKKGGEMRQCPQTSRECEIKACAGPNACALLARIIYYEIGWECPRCHRIHAPHVPTCGCSPPTIATTKVIIS